VGCILALFFSHSITTTGRGAPVTESASDLLEDLGSQLFGPGDRSTDRPADAPPPDQSQKAGEDLGQPRQDSPLTAVSSGMRQAERLIAQRNLSGETAQIQEQVLGALDQLIKQLEQQNQSSSSQSQSQSQQQQQTSQRSTPQSAAGQQPAGQQAPGGATAAQTSSDRLQSGEGGGVAGEGAQALLKDVWGQLPERLRQQLLQSSTDEFLPQYRDDIERYFRRLAEEEPAK
jgi:hypothetical protein